MVSNCCGASIVPESIDVCSNCKEHCDVVSEEDYFDEAMDTSNKNVSHNGSSFKQSCETCQWHIQGKDKSKDMMCRNCSLAYTSNWTKKEYHGQ